MVWELTNFEGLLLEKGQVLERERERERGKEKSAKNG
jgi:hypothetical protein